MVRTDGVDARTLKRLFIDLILHKSAASSLLKINKRHSGRTSSILLTNVQFNNKLEINYINKMCFMSSKNEFSEK